MQNSLVDKSCALKLSFISANFNNLLPPNSFKLCLSIFLLLPNALLVLGKSPVFFTILDNRVRSRTGVAILMFQSALILKNRFRSRTRVAIVMFQRVLSVKNRLHYRASVAILMFQNALLLKTRLRSRTVHVSQFLCFTV